MENKDSFQSDDQSGRNYETCAEQEPVTEALRPRVIDQSGQSPTPERTSNVASSIATATEGWFDIGLLPVEEINQLDSQVFSNLSLDALNTITPQQIANLAPRHLDAIVRRYNVALGGNAPSSKHWYSLSTVVQAPFPHRKLRNGQTRFSRTTGNLTVTYSASNKNSALPSGIPARVLFHYICSELVKKRTKEIDFGSTMRSLMKESLGVAATTGRTGTIRSYEEQLANLFDCVIGIERRTEIPGEQVQLERRILRIGCAADLARRTTEQAIQGTVRVSDEFFDAVIKSPVPIDRETVIELTRTKSPLALDIYIWLSYRTFLLQKSDAPILRITWRRLYEQFGGSYSEITPFKDAFQKALLVVQQHYPEARVTPRDDSLYILRGKPHVQSLEPA